MGTHFKGIRQTSCSKNMLSALSALEKAISHKIQCTYKTIFISHYHKHKRNPVDKSLETLTSCLWRPCQ